MGNSYLEDDMVVASVICTSTIDLWTLIVPLIFFEFVEMYCSDCIMQQFGFK